MYGCITVVIVLNTHQVNCSEVRMQQLRKTTERPFKYFLKLDPSDLKDTHLFINYYWKYLHCANPSLSSLLLYSPHSNRTPIIVCLSNKHDNVIQRYRLLFHLLDIRLTVYRLFSCSCSTAVLTYYYCCSFTLKAFKRWNMVWLSWWGTHRKCEAVTRWALSNHLINKLKGSTAHLFLPQPQIIPSVVVAVIQEMPALTNLYTVSAQNDKNSIFWPCVFSNVPTSVPVSNTIVLGVICESQFHTELYFRLPRSQAMLTRLVGNAGLQFKKVNFGYEQQIAADLCMHPASWCYPTAFIYSHTFENTKNCWNAKRTGVCGLFRVKTTNDQGHF